MNSGIKSNAKHRDIVRIPFVPETNTMLGILINYVMKRRRKQKREMVTIIANVETISDGEPISIPVNFLPTKYEKITIVDKEDKEVKRCLTQFTKECIDKYGVENAVKEGSIKLLSDPKYKGVLKHIVEKALAEAFVKAYIP